MTAAPTADDLLVACLCAGWCTTCTAYRGTLAEVAAAHPALRFAWIDIEDDSDALGDSALDIENFPTVMLLRAGRVLFHGTLLPHAATLLRLLEALRNDALAPGDAAAVPAEMAAAVWRLGPERPI
ncbi:thioredoxin family protein [Aquabacterium sp.]|uniref:thioredoxin family protein n=1 Tax=Aquabacterium sp. TaxID=1872578 RepID=UPI0037842C11